MSTWRACSPSRLPASVGLSRLKDLLRTPTSTPAAEHPLPVSRLAAEIGFDRVDFGYTADAPVAVSDVEKDPRFYAGISEKLNYDVKSVLCAPMMTHGRTFGCVQLLNKKGSSNFGEHEVGILSYIAHQGALYLNRRV